MEAKAENRIMAEAILNAIESGAQSPMAAQAERKEAEAEELGQGGGQ